MPVQDLPKKGKNEVYSHIFNKGVEQRNLFNDSQDYEVFLGYLKEYLSDPTDSEIIKKDFTVNGRIFQGIPHQPKNYFKKVELIAYSLLPDHFHLLIHQLTNGSLEKLVRSLCTRYAIYYNKKYQRTGSLFSGPYKSVQIKEVPELLHLTRFFHRESLEEKSDKKDVSINGYSSYEEYLGERVSLWIKPKVVLSFFDKSENDYFKGVGGYKNFVENYEPKQDEKDILEKIIIESKSIPLERTILKPEKSESFKEVGPESILEPKAHSDNTKAGENGFKTPLFVITSALIFVLLTSFGIRNIKISEAITQKTANAVPTQTPQVSGAEDEQVESIKMLVIKITDGAESVNIRSGPSTKSEILGKAKDGDFFEFISKEEDWYQIKIDNEVSAYVSERYVQMEGDIDK